MGRLDRVEREREGGLPCVWVGQEIYHRKRRLQRRGTMSAVGWCGEGNLDRRREIEGAGATMRCRASCWARLLARSLAVILRGLRCRGGRMERVALLRSLSCSTTAYRRLLFRPRLFSSNFCRPQPHELQLRALSCSGASRWRPGPAPPLRLRRRFSPSIRAISTSPSPASRGAEIDRSDIAEKLGFEIISEQTINECKATAVLYKHKKTGAEIMSVSNDDENKVFGVVFRTPP
ncbi:hypothetical protein BHE74_00002106 [Ensete ventricosum]|nr:hypothetical protein GW17_00010713 [Ensete ventricosum]RWW88996.1 hypothetical protein BHE74_00002106 [Ensete ventricosum]